MATVCSAPDCDKSLPPATGSRPRLYCDSSCRRRAHEARKANPAAAPTVPADSVVSDLAGAVRKELEAGGRAETVSGQLAIAMARRIDSSGTTASSMASLSKELRALLAEALEGVKRPGAVEDPVDQARASRDVKLHAVS